MNLLLSFIMCVTINYPFLVNIIIVYIYIYSEKYVFQFSKNRRIMERNNGKWNFDETKRSDTRASIERYIFDSFDSSKNTGLMKLGNFPFTLLENLRENSPGE